VFFRSRLKLEILLYRNSFMLKNSALARLRSGGVILGSELSGLRTPEVARVYAAAGFDFVFIDMEHSSFSLETVAELVRAARQAKITPIVRVPQAEYVWVSRVLDGGAQGIIVPRVNTPRQVEEIVSWTRYPPRGIRGFACTSAATDGETLSPTDYIEHVDRETLVVIQIERQEALDNLDRMLAVPGVDVACMGCMDLSADLGVPGEIGHPRMVAAIERVHEVATRNHLASGIITPDMSLIEQWVKRGMRFASYATDALLLLAAAHDTASQMRRLCPGGDRPCP
jgi:2-keto-3-deoxy-L-rhamnonate aldolase RhmA